MLADATRTTSEPQPPPRAHPAPRSGRELIIIEGDRPRSVSPSPTRIIVVEKRRRSEPVRFWPWFCGTFCCCLICFDCADDCCVGCCGGCCPEAGYDSD